jgi:hypothetical protein
MWTWLDKVKNVISECIFWAEGLEGKTGEEKLNLVADKVAGLINVPFIPDWLEKPLKTAALKPIINLMVDKFNWLFDWNFKGATLTDEQNAKLAEVAEAPVSVVAKAMASVPKEASIDEKLEALYREYKITPGPQALDPIPASREETVETAHAQNPPVGRDWEKAIAFVLAREGGYVDDPDDKGGETNMGITAATLAGACAAGLVNHCVVKDLTRAEAERIYRANYWDRYGWDKIPWPACLCLFDATVHHGAGGMAKIAQRTANALSWKLDIDGKFGPKTLESTRESRKPTRRGTSKSSCGSARNTSTTSLRRTTPRRSTGTAGTTV